MKCTRSGKKTTKACLKTMTVYFEEHLAVIDVDRNKISRASPHSTSGELASKYKTSKFETRQGNIVNTQHGFFHLK